MDNAKAIDKVRKLLSLANNNTSVEEASSAMAAAQRIMAEYQIEAASLEDAADAGPQEAVGHEVLVDEGGRTMAGWRATLANALCKANNCKGYKSGPRLCYIGRASDAQTIRYMFAYITAEIERLCTAAGAGVKYKDAGHGFVRTWNNSFKVGAANEVSSRLAKTVREVAQAAEAQGKGQALAVIRTHQDALELYGKEKLRLRTTYSNTPLNGGAYAAGRQAGAGIQLGGGPRLAGPRVALGR